MVWTPEPGKIFMGRNLAGECPEVGMSLQTQRNQQLELLGQGTFWKAKRFQDQVKFKMKVKIYTSRNLAVINEAMLTAWPAFLLHDLEKKGAPSCFFGQTDIYKPA